MSRYEEKGVKFEFRGIKSLSKLHSAFVGLKDQKTETCGPYSLLKIVRSLHGYPENSVTEDSLAQLSGTLISEEELRVSKDNMGAKEGDMEENIRQMYYPLKLGISNKEEELGTSAEGVFRAMKTMLGDDYSIISIPARVDGDVQLTVESFSALTSALWRHLPDLGLQAILNCQMNRLCSNRGLKSLFDVLDFITKGGTEEDEEWNVGHFMVFCGLFSAKTADGEKKYFLIQDSYKSRGMQGYRIQPEERVRRSLVRDDGREGGILFAIPKGDSARFLGDIGVQLATGIWDNGTPYMANGQV